MFRSSEFRQNSRQVPSTVLDQHSRRDRVWSGIDEDHIDANAHRIGHDFTLVDRIIDWSSHECWRGCEFTVSHSSDLSLTTPIQLLVHKAELVSIVKFMIEHCKSERAFTSAGRIYANMLVTLTNVWPREHRSVNKDEQESERKFPLDASWST